MDSQFLEMTSEADCIYCPLFDGAFKLNVFSADPPKRKDAINVCASHSVVQLWSCCTQVFPYSWEACMPWSRWHPRRWRCRICPWHSLAAAKRHFNPLATARI